MEDICKVCGSKEIDDWGCLSCLFDAMLEMGWVEENSPDED